MKNTEKTMVALKSGTISDGNGLYLEAPKTGNKRWLFRWTDARGKAAKMSLGRFRQARASGKGLTLLEARAKALELQTALHEGEDPRKEKWEVVRTFGEAAERYIEVKTQELTNEKHKDQWRTTLMGGGRAPDYCKKLRPVMLTDVDMQAVLATLKPIWTEKPETASRIRGRIEKVLDFARVQRWRQGDNPARWEGNLEHVLPKPQKLSRGHMASMPYVQVPEFFQSIAVEMSHGGAALAWTILTAVRSGETRGATWDEIDTEARTWAIPVDRMKAKSAHVVPLSGAAIDILAIQRDATGGDGLIFPGARGAKLSDMTLAAHLKRRQMKYTVHGFRSSFRDWAAEKSGHSFDVIETALAHKVGSAVAQAYMRTDLLDKRRDLMGLWAQFLRYNA